MSAPVGLGILLAGGRGARLGAGSPKASVVLGGVSLFERALAALAAVSAEIVVAVPGGFELPPVARHAYDVVFDVLPDAGPLAGLASAAGRELPGRVVVLGVDFPFVDAEVLRVLVRRFEEARVESGCAALVPAPGGVPQPLAACYTGAAVRRLEEAFSAGERTLTCAVAALGPVMLDDAALEQLGIREAVAFNLNTPADLAEAERRLAAARAGVR